MSGNSRMTIGEITQSTMKGKAMQNMLNKSLNDETPLALNKQKKENKRQGKKK